MGPRLRGDDASGESIIRKSYDRSSGVDVDRHPEERPKAASRRMIGPARAVALRDASLRSAPQDDGSTSSAPTLLELEVLLLRHLAIAIERGANETCEIFRRVGRGFDAL